jgi:undecaprenyl pyrophosphate phosphatase UppP
VVEAHKGISVLPAIGPCVAGFLCSLLIGYLSLFLVERLVTQGKFIRFAPYTFLVAVLCFTLYFRG